MLTNQYNFIHLFFFFFPLPFSTKERLELNLMLGQMTSPLKSPMQSLTMGNTMWFVSRGVVAMPRCRWTAGQWSSATLQVSQWMCIQGRFMKNKVENKALFCICFTKLWVFWETTEYLLHYRVMRMYCCPKLFLKQCTSGIL